MNDELARGFDPKILHNLDLRPGPVQQLIYLLCIHALIGIG